MRERSSHVEERVGAVGADENNSLEGYHLVRTSSEGQTSYPAVHLSDAL